MATNNWTELGRFRWRHDGLDAELDLGRDRKRDKIVHLIRESWRQRRFHLFCASGRRDVPPDGTTISDKRSSKTRNTFYKADGAVRAVMIGTVYSPAMLRASGKACAERCVWGCELPTEQLDLEHLWWSCPCRPRLAPQRPCDHMLRRFGWPRAKGESTCQCCRQPWRILEFQAHVCEKIWEQRYPDRAMRTLARHTFVPRLLSDRQQDSDSDDQSQHESDDMVQGTCDSDASNSTPSPSESGSSSGSGDLVA